MDSGPSDCRRAEDRVSLRATVGPESQAVTGLHPGQWPL